MRVLNIFLFVTFSVLSYGQSLPEKLSLKQAQEIALSQHPEIVLKKTNEAISIKQTEQIKTQKVPEVLANYDLRRNLIIPTTPVPAIAFDPTAKEGELLPLKFASNWMSNTGINATYNLFNPVLSGQIKESNQQTLLHQIETAIAAHEVKAAVTNSYAAWAIAEEQLEMAVADTVYSGEIYAIVLERHQAGRVQTPELNRVQIAKNNSLSNYYQALRIRDAARTQLQADMGLDPSREQTFELADELDRLLENYSQISFQSMESLSEKQYEQQQALNRLQTDNAKAELYPSLLLSGYLGANYFDNSFQLWNGSNWYGNSFINLSLNIPLTRVYEKNKKVDILRLQAKANEAQYQIKSNQTQLAIQETNRDIQFQQSHLQLSKENLDLALADLETARLQYERGRLLADELSRQNQTYQQAKNSYLQAAYDLLSSGIRLEQLAEE